MTYWGYFAAKLVAAWGLSILLKQALRSLIGVPDSVTKFGHQPFGHDLTWTTAMMFYTLICIGMIYLVILDQKYRCRSCLSRLRMPVNMGSWGRATIFSPPRTEYICPFGHGTMKQHDLQLTGRENPDWVEHSDMWEELESLSRK